MNKSSGFTVLEWLISCVIGLFLMAGAFSIYVMSRNNNRQLQIYNEMQENGRIAMNLLQNDLRMTGFFGDLTGQPIRLNSNIKTKIVFSKGQDCRDERAESGGTLPDSGDNGVLRPLMIRHVNGSGSLNDELSCLAKIRLQSNSDVVVLKRLFGNPLSLRSSDWDPERIYLAANSNQGMFFSGADKTVKTELASLYHSQIREYQHHIYFIQQSGTVPELRLIQLTDKMNAGLSLPLVQGVERLRVLVAVDESVPADGITDKYLLPEQVPPTIWNTFAITGVHLFLLIRALDPSPDYLNEQRYLMGDQSLPPFNDHYQRLLMQTSVYFPNAGLPKD